MEAIISKNIHIVIGSSGGIGSSFVRSLSKDIDNKIYAFSKSKKLFNLPNVIECSIDVSCEKNIEHSAKNITEKGQVISIIIATGILYDRETKPERSLREINRESLEKIFSINAFAPILIAKYFLPLISHDRRTTFSAISARVGSISDNRLGGWYSYRASKAALNMLLKTLSIEVKRKYKKLIVIGLHPGTVDTVLSEPFQANIPKGKLFTPDYSINSMLTVLNNVCIEDSGNLFDYNGHQISP
ncbi:MAG: NAD(P)-dependent dehydrogenase (short-subunit alcohol dehydrogenase family) [Francisellaceae bacterium]